MIVVFCSPLPGKILLNYGTLLSIVERSAASGSLRVGTLQSMGLCPPCWRYCDCCIVYPLPARIFSNCGTLLSIYERSAVSG